MQLKIKNELLLIIAFTFAAIMVAAFTHIQALRIALGLPFLLFMPGYVFIAALFPGKNSMPVGERLILSFAFSFVIVALIGLVLNYIWAIRLTPILTAQAIFVAVASGAAWYRRALLPPEERLQTILDLSFILEPKTGKLNSTLNIILVLTILGTIGVLGYTVTNPRVGERFTEFYILGTDGKASGYPTELNVGQEGKVILGIINREHEKIGYKVEISIGGITTETIGPISLDHNAKWEREVGFVPQELSADTILTEAVYGPGNISAMPKISTIQVESADSLKTDDHIWIGSEAARVHAIDGLNIILEEPLREYHTAGEPVIESQEVAFNLYKIRTLKFGTTEQTALSLRLGKDGAAGIVTNQGEDSASYRTRVMIKGDGDQAAGTRELGPVTLAVGEEWNPIFNFNPPLNVLQEEQFELYRNGKLIYKEKTADGYPTLHLWVYVQGD